jgi:para-nitrobenzyl esterase
VTRVSGRIALTITAAVVAASTVTTPAAISDPVTISTGQISGLTLPSGARAFKGIPFGAPPVGELRWEDPQPPATWEGVRKAEQFGNVRAAIAAEPISE